MKQKRFEKPEETLDFGKYVELSPKGILGIWLDSRVSGHFIKVAQKRGQARFLRLADDVAAAAAEVRRRMA